MMRFRRWWHERWLAHFERQHRRAEHRMTYHNDVLRHLEWKQDFSEPAPFVQDFSPSVQISGTGPEPESLDTTHLRHLFPVPDQDMDGPDSPEADHAFWEQTAEDVLGGGLAVPEAWQVGLPDDPPDDPLSS